MAFGSEQWMYNAGGGFYPHEIDQSLRFDGASYLTRTPSVTGNRKTFTWSGWVKRSALNGSTNTLFQQRLDSNSSKQFSIQFRGEHYLRVLDQDNGNELLLDTTALYRDMSAWYHVVVAVDTTLPTASDRVKVYVNGERITSFVSPTYYSSNYSTSVNVAGWRALIGAARPNQSSTLSNFLNGYLAENYLVDGQALDPTDFGEFKSGVWIPKEYEGTYGTNGFYLDFGNAGSLGADVSGNGNNWTPTNLASTDQMLDSPTNNFATLNPLSKGISSGAGAVPLSEGNLEFTGSGTISTFGTYYSTLEIPDTELHYFEMVPTAIGTAAKTSQKLNVAGVFFAADGSTNTGSYGSAWSPADVIGVAVSPSGVWFSVNGVWQNSGDPVAGTNPAGTPWASTILTGDGSATTNSTLSGVLNFGQDSSFAGNKTRQGNTDANGRGDFYYAPPAGYLALCSANLPDPAIDPAEDDIPADYFNPVIFTANNGTQSITGVGFQPDFVWAKSRGNAYNHDLYDSVRGVGRFLRSNNSGAESVVANTLTSFDSDGFTLGVDSNANYGTAASVSWNWKAGGTAVANTDGTIASQVSANQKAGFSIVGYTGNGSNATVGHGLSSAPEMIIFKNRTSSGNSWVVYSSELGATKYLLLSSADAAGTYNHFQNTTPTSSVAYITGGATAVNANTNNYIAYCFHSVEGFSKFGSYTGNGSADGPFVYTGFRPAFVMFKRTDTTGNWAMIDADRNAYNVVNERLFADLSDAASTLFDVCDFTSNGFKFRTNAGSTNASGGTYIYMAFAEMPFKYANAR